MSASQAECRGFESLLPLREKVDVVGLNPITRSKVSWQKPGHLFSLLVHTIVLYEAMLGSRIYTEQIMLRTDRRRDA